VHLSTEPISASQELRAVKVWRWEDQVSSPPSQITKPAMERVLKRSSWMGGSSGYGTDWSCGPQFASVNRVMRDGSRGNWTKDSMLEYILLENWMPRSNVPLRYWIVYLTASMWLGEQSLLY